MTTSINTNIGALVALQNLAKVNRDLEQTQNRVSTGFRVSTAKDDGATFAVAQNLRGDVQALDTVNAQLSVAIGLVDVTLEASTSISNTLNTIKATIVKLADENLSTTQRAQYEADFDSLYAELANYVSNAVYNGRNLIETGAANIAVISNADGTQYTIAANDLQTTIDALNGAKPADAASAAQLLDGTNTALTDAITAAGNALNAFAADSKRLKNQITFNTAVRDATDTGLGAIVDADLARESARLQSLQTKQQLSVQALGIANQAPQSILSLFRS